MINDRNYIDGPHFITSRANFFVVKKNDVKALLLYFNEEKNQRLDIIERELKKIMIVKLYESNCKMMKSGKQILKNKALGKPNEVVKTRE
jgi:hypothetical protein